MSVSVDALQWLGLLLAFMGCCAIGGAVQRVLGVWERMRDHRDEAPRPVMRDWSRP